MNHKYFEHWSANMAYYLGWLWADGNICDGKLQVGCVTKDEEIVLGLMREIESHHIVQRLPGYIHKKGYEVAPYTKVSIYSKDLVSCLVNKHGILPRKTYLDSSFPKMEQQYLPHFIRGYFDGDGTIFKNKNNMIGISLIGTKKFVIEMQDAIYSKIGIPRHPPIKSKNTTTPTAAWNVGWNAKAEVLTFLNFIYNGEPWLTRKKDLANMWMPELMSYCQWCGIENRNGRIRLRFLNRRLGEYKTVEECMWARNYAHEKVAGYQYPIAAPRINLTQQKEIANLIEMRLAGDKTHQSIVTYRRASPAASASLS